MFQYSHGYLIGNTRSIYLVFYPLSSVHLSFFLQIWSKDDLVGKENGSLKNKARKGKLLTLPTDNPKKAAQLIFVVILTQQEISKSNQHYFLKSDLSISFLCGMCLL